MYFQEPLPYEYYETTVKAIRKKVELIRVCKWNRKRAPNTKLPLVLTGDNLMCLIPNFPKTKTFVFKVSSSSYRAPQFVKEDQDEIEIVPDPSTANIKFPATYSGNYLIYSTRSLGIFCNIS